MALPSPFVPVQVAIMLAAGAAALMPPAQGAVLIWSPAGETAGRIGAWALDGGNRLIAAGPLPGSLVVWGDGARIGALARAHGALAMRAPLSSCGGRA